MSTHNMFLWRNKKNFNTFGLIKKHLIKSYELYVLNIALDSSRIYPARFLNSFFFLHESIDCKYPLELHQKNCLC